MKSPRQRFIDEQIYFNSSTLRRLAAYAWDAMQLASTHDPDHAKELKNLHKRISILERKIIKG